jgi:hypothetical protein
VGFEPVGEGKGRSVNYREREVEGGRSFKRE